jgi:hypothetical protein
MSRKLTSKHATPLPPSNSCYRFRSGTTERPRKAHISLAEQQNFARANSRRRRPRHEYVEWEEVCCWSASECRCVMALSHDAAGCGQNASWRAGTIMRVRPSENGNTRRANQQQQQYADVITNHETSRPIS